MHVQMRLTLVLTRPPRQFRIPRERDVDQSPCSLANASWMCSGLKAVRASGGCMKSEHTGSGVSESSSGVSSRLRLLGESKPIPTLRLPRRGDVLWSSRR